MLAFAELAEAVSKTTKKTIKVGLVSSYLHDHPVEEAALAALFLSGKAFPAHTETTLQVGGSLIWQALERLTGRSSGAMNAAYRRYGDLGSAAADLLALTPSVAPLESPPLTPAAVEEIFLQLANARGQAARLSLIEELLRRATPLEAKYLIKIMTGELRIGLREGLVEDAIAAAFGEDPALVRRANMLLGDISQTLRLAAEHRLQDARLRLFHPFAMMLASPVETTEEAVQHFEKALVEDKYDGIRAQAHIGLPDQQPRIFSRTLDDVTASFPELAHALRAIPGPCILDGEVVAWHSGRALPFSDLQQRLGRKSPTPELMRQVPVAYVAFDVLFIGEEFLIDHPLAERRKKLEDLFARVSSPLAYDPEKAVRPQQQLFSLAPSPGQMIEGTILASPTRQATTTAELDLYFAEAQARGNEGLMVKDVGSPYTPGRRGKSWLKIKRELATLDVVVTAVEYGHGKRAGVLSDYTFAVRHGDQLLNIGKAYSGLTDSEIAANHQWFLEHTIAEEGHRRTVEPKLVLEVAFNNMMKSDRHESGLALRFPRILRIRNDKPPSEVDTLERAQQIYSTQFKKAS
jgi:DNA ligase 1